MSSVPSPSITTKKSSLIEIRNPSLSKRHKWSLDNSLWNDGIIYYKFSKSIPCITRAWVERSMRFYEKVTCVRFRLNTKLRKSYVKIEGGNACSATVGDESTVPLVGWIFKSTITLSINCGFKEILHELGHTLGMGHTQSRSDRDEYVKIVTENIKSKHRHNYRKKMKEKLFVPYDYNSIMHYGPFDFAKNPLQPTMYRISKANEDEDAKRIRFGQREHLSSLDIENVNLMYKCRRKQCEKPRIVRRGLCLLPGDVRHYCEDNNECTKGLECVYNRCVEAGKRLSPTFIPAPRDKPPSAARRLPPPVRRRAPPRDKPPKSNPSSSSSSSSSNSRSRRRLPPPRRRDSLHGHGGSHLRDSHRDSMRGRGGSHLRDSSLVARPPLMEDKN